MQIFAYTGEMSYYFIKVSSEIGQLYQDKKNLNWRKSFAIAAI